MTPNPDTSLIPHPSSLAPRGAAWPGYAGLALLLFAVWRGTVNEAWDGWCWFSAVLGAGGVGAWAAGRRAVLQARVRTRGARYAGHSVVSSVLLLAVLALLNFLAARHNHAFDLTEAGLFTLSPQTKQALHALNQDVLARAFFPAGRRAQAADLLRRYADESRHFRYEMIDPDQDPDQAQKNGVTSYGTVVLQVEGRPGPPIRVEAEQTGQRGLTLTEEKLTNAVLKVVRGGAKTVYFLEGHGEADINSPQTDGYLRLRQALENQAFVVKPLVLARSGQVPADCSVLVIAGPAKEPLPQEMAAINSYMQQGGKLLVLVDPAPGAGLPKFLGDWGIQEKQDLIMDVSGAGRAYGAGPAMPLVTDYNPQSPITKDFRQMTFFPLVRSLTANPTPGDAIPEYLAMTGQNSFSEPYSGDGRRHTQFNAKTDKKGPFGVAMSVTRMSTTGREARLVAIGSSNFVSNPLFDRGGNGDFLLNCMNWLAEGDQLIAIPPRPRQDHRIELTEQQSRGVFWLTVLGMPAAPLLCAAIVFWRRRAV